MVYFFCFKNETLEHLLHLVFKAEFPTNAIQDVPFLALKSIQT